MCIKTYLIVLIPIFDKLRKRKNRSKYSYEFYILHWYYFLKVGIFQYLPLNEIEGEILVYTPSLIARYIVISYEDENKFIKYIEKAYLY